MSKKVSLSLSSKSIENAIAELKQYEKWIQVKTKEFTEKLALIGVKEASVRFTTAMYDGINDVTVALSPTVNGYVITASGEAVAFIEFGSGVYHNPSEPYPEPRPNGIVGIGEYGKGLGKRQGWVYSDGAKKHFTRGNPAAMPMWYATKEMEENIAKVAKEVFR